MNFKEQFKDVFEPELLQEIENTGAFGSVKEGEVILDFGQTVRMIPIVLSGILKISRLDEKGNELLLYYIHPMESCAMTFTCCMQHLPSEIKATAEEDVQFIGIPISIMDEWMMKYASWKSFIMKTIRSRFMELLKSIDKIAFQKLDQRLIYYLKEKSNLFDSTLLNISHEQIANDLASSREVISRLLKKLENDKKVILYRNQIKILNEL